MIVCAGILCSCSPQLSDSSVPWNLVRVIDAKSGTHSKWLSWSLESESVDVTLRAMNEREPSMPIPTCLSVTSASKEVLFERTTSGTSQLLAPRGIAWEVSSPEGKHALLVNFVESEDGEAGGVNEMVLICVGKRVKLVGIDDLGAALNELSERSPTAGKSSLDLVVRRVKRNLELADRPHLW